MFRLMFLVPLCTLSGCLSSDRVAEPAIKKYHDKEQMEAEVKKHISIGMPLEQARRIMEGSGFKCSEDFWCEPPHLSCVASSPRNFLMSDEISIRLYHEGGVVTGLKVACYTIGP